MSRTGKDNILETRGGKYPHGTKWTKRAEIRQRYILKKEKKVELYKTTKTEIKKEKRKAISVI